MSKISRDQPKSAKPDTLVKPSKNASIELSESDLKKVAGGQKINTIKIE